MADDAGPYSTGKTNVEYRGWVPYCEPVVDFWGLVDEAAKLTRMARNASNGLVGLAQHQAKKRMHLLVTYRNITAAATPMRQHTRARLFLEERILCEITVRTAR